MARQVSTVICERSNLLREGLGYVMREHPYRVSASVTSFSDLQDDLLKKTCCSLLLVGLVEVTDAVLQKLRAIKGRHSDIRIIVLVDRYSSNDVLNVFDANIDGFLVKTTTRDALLKSLELVLMGEHVFTAKAQVRMGEEVRRIDVAPQLEAPPEAAPSQLTYSRDNSALSDVWNPGDTANVNYGRNGLSERERDILACIVRGCSNKIIARQCNITEATVKVHMKAILRKIQVRNRTQAAVWAMGRNFGPDASLPTQNNGDQASHPSVSTG